MNTLHLFRHYYLKREIETIMNMFYLKWVGTWIGGVLFSLIGIDSVNQFLAAKASDLWIFLSSLEALTVTIFWLMTADWITGMIAARRKKVMVESRKIMRTAIKFVVATICIYCPYLITVKMDLPMNLAYFPAGVIIVTELKSLLENGSAILGYDVATRVVDVLKGLVKK